MNKEAVNTTIGESPAILAMRRNPNTGATLLTLNWIANNRHFTLVTTPIDANARAALIGIATAIRP
jgi:hypothetical protein